MSMRTKPQHFSFTSPGTMSGSADFGNTVRSAAVPIQGYSVTFGSSDHHFRDLEVAVANVTTNDTEITYDLIFKLQDGSSNKGSAEIDVVVIADVEA